MPERQVFLLKTWLESSAALRAFGVHHYAVQVGYDVYELDGVGGGKKKGKSTFIRKRAYQQKNIFDVKTLVGATKKTDDKIKNFNDQWLADFPSYDALGDNCQKFALDFIQFLVGASCKMNLPFSSKTSWAGGPASHATSEVGYHQARATFGKAGGQLGVIGAEAEGPSVGAEAVDAYVGVEASLFRAEGQIGPVGARVQPNINTGLGVTDGQLKAKVLGFGASAGGKGVGLHTPLGSLGIGNF